MNKSTRMLFVSIALFLPCGLDAQPNQSTNPPPPSVPPRVVTNYSVVTNYTIITNYSLVTNLLIVSPATVSNFATLTRNLLDAAGVPTPQTNYVTVEKTPPPPEARLEAWIHIAPLFSAGFFFLSVIFTCLAFLQTLAENARTASRTARNNLDNMLFQTDRAQIDDPTLWSLYDTEDRTPKGFKGRDRVKREMSLYMHFNMLAAAFNHYHRHAGIKRRAWFFPPKKADKHETEYRTAWDNYTQQFFEHSTDARKLFLRRETQAVYAEEFRKHVNQIIETFNRIGFTEDDIKDVAALMKRVTAAADGLAGNLKAKLYSIGPRFGEEFTTSGKVGGAAKELLVQILNSFLLGSPQQGPLPVGKAPYDLSDDNDRNQRLLANREALEKAFPNELRSRAERGAATPAQTPSRPVSPTSARPTESQPPQQSPPPG